MADSPEKLIDKALVEAHALERQAEKLLSTGARIVGDDGIAAIYRAHLLQTKAHARYVAERLRARGSSTSSIRDLSLQGVALGLGALLRTAPQTPIRLSSVAFAFENLEIAHYRFLQGASRRGGDHETAAIAERITEQEEAAAELVAGTFDRALELTVGADPVSPVPPVTPLGKPSERGGLTGHPGPQISRRKPVDEPVDKQPDISAPPPGRPASPAPGHPVGEAKPTSEDAPAPPRAGARGL